MPSTQSGCAGRQRPLPSQPHIAPGEAYFAIKGDVHEGIFSSSRAEGGAALAVVEAASAKNSPTTRRFWWSMTYSPASSRWRHASRRALNAQIIAVTGSVGKTSTRGAAARARRAGETHASAASFNNHWGVPFSLARLPRPKHVLRLRDR